jgi:hypothetical protein
MKKSQLKQIIKEEISKVLNENNQQLLDTILDKLSTDGIESLTPEETNFLDMFSKGELNVGHVMSNDDFLKFLNLNKDIIFDEIYSQHGYDSKDISNLKKYYKFIKLTDGEEFPWYGVSSTIDMGYPDSRRADADTNTSREPVNIAQSEYDFLQDFIQAALDGYLDDEEPEVFSKNIMGKSIYYSIISW